MDKILSIRKNNQVFSLFLKIQEYQKSANRTDIVNAAIQKALEDRKNGGLNWNAIASGKIPSVYIENDDFPEFIQLRVDEDKYAEIIDQMKKDFNLEKCRAPFVVKLLLINYILFLESNGVEIVRPKKEEPTVSKQKLMEVFKKLSTEEKMDAIYELLLELNK